MCSCLLENYNFLAVRTPLPVCTHDATDWGRLKMQDLSNAGS